MVEISRVEINRVEIAKAEINTTRISKEKIALFHTKPLFIAHCARVIMALMFSLSANAQQIGAEIEYVDDSVTNQIPYFDNRFRIDEQLDEVTLIFYHRRGAKPIILIRPDGSKLNINNYPEDKVQWFDDQTFDMLKIKSPMIGPWQVIGQVEANSKIMVVSEIRLEVSPLPEIILQGETLKMVARLFNGDLIIDDPLFQNVLTLNVNFFSTNNSAFDNFGAAPIQLASFYDNGRDLDEYANDSLFTGEFELDFASGEWQPIYIVKMPMITRELRQKPIVVQKNPISISVVTNQGENKTHVVTFTIDDSLVSADSILIQGKVTFPDQQVEPFTVVQEQGLTRTHTIDFTEPGVHRIKVKVFGDIQNGREFQAILPEFTFNVDRLLETGILAVNRGSNNLTSEQKNAQAIANAAIEAEKLAQVKATQEAKVANKQQATLLYIVGGNTLVIIIAALMFVFIRRKKRK
jgi:uncharacterized protein (TIGR03503 family)